MATVRSTTRATTRAVKTTPERKNTEKQGKNVVRGMIIAVLTATVIASFTVAIMIIALYGRDCDSYDIDIEGNATDKTGEANVEFISHIRVHNEGTD
jgi:hypothetical protein